MSWSKAGGQVTEIIRRTISEHYKKKAVVLAKELLRSTKEPVVLVTETEDGSKYVCSRIKHLGSKRSAQIAMPYLDQHQSWVSFPSLMWDRLRR